MSDFGSGIERYGPRFELSGRASKADLRRRIAALEVERDALYERRLPCREAEVAQKRYEDAETALTERDRVLRLAGEQGDFPCTYCRGMDHHDPTCQLLVLRRIPEPHGCHDCLLSDNLLCPLQPSSRPRINCTEWRARAKE